MRKIFNTNARKYVRNQIVVKLADGHKILVSNRARKMKVSFSEAIRQAVQSWLGI